MDCFWIAWNRNNIVFMTRIFLLYLRHPFLCRLLITCFISSYTSIKFNNALYLGIIFGKLFAANKKPSPGGFAHLALLLRGFGQITSGALTRASVICNFGGPTESRTDRTASG